MEVGSSSAPIQASISALKKAQDSSENVLKIVQSATPQIQDIQKSSEDVAQLIGKGTLLDLQG